jgi:hypothetical protein
MDLSKLSQNQKIALGGGVLAILALFMPWYGVGPFTANAFSFFFAWVGLILAIAGAAILVLKAMEMSDVKLGSLAAEQLALVLAAVGVVLIVLKLLTDTDFLKYGLFIGLISAGAVAYGAFGSMKDAGLELPSADDFRPGDS